MQFSAIIDGFFMVFNDLNSIIVSILNILYKLSYNYFISNQVYLLTNSKIGNDYDNNDAEFVDKVTESVIIDNGSGMITASGESTGESTKSLMLPNVVIRKEANGGGHFAHINNLNDHYLQFYNDQLLMYRELLFAVLIESNKIADWSEMTAIWEHVLADTMREERVVANQLILPANPVEYNVQSCYLSNTAFADIYYGNKMKYDSEATLAEPLFVKYSITSRVPKERTEYSKNTDVTSHTS